MKPLSRKSFAAASAGAFAGIGILRWPASAAEFTYKYANDNPLTHPMSIAMTAWANKIKEDSGGQLEIQVFPGSQLGSDPEMLTQLRAGGIQFLHLSGAILSTFVPVASIDGVGYTLTNYKQVWDAMDGQLGQYVRGEIAKTGLHVFDKQVDNGFRQMTNSAHPITSPADLKGLKFRVPPAKLYVSMFQTLGAAPATISIAEVYSALQTKVVDGQENPMLIIENNKFYEVQKYISITNHIWAGWWLLGNGDAWNKLPKKLQDLCSTTYEAAVQNERKLFLSDTAALQPKLAAQGMSFNTPEPAPFVKALRDGGYYSQWRDAFGPTAWNLLEKYTGKIA